MCSSRVCANFPLVSVLDVHVNSTILRSKYASWKKGNRRRKSNLVGCCVLGRVICAQEFVAFMEDNFEVFLFNAQSSICDEVRQANFFTNFHN
jgi:hypothetical protein